MKKILFPLGITMMILLSCSPKVVIDREAETRAIQEVLESFYKAMIETDLVTMQDLTMEDFLAFDVGNMYSLEEIVAMVNSFREQGMTNASFKLEPITSEVYPDAAILCYKNTGTFLMGGFDVTMEFLESAWFDKTEDGWKLRFFHSTEVPKEEPAEAAEGEQG